MKCSEFLNELTNYLDGVLDEQTKAELENHLSWCHNCYVVCDTTKKTIEIYRDSRTLRTARRPAQPPAFGHHDQVPAHKKCGPQKL